MKELVSYRNQEIFQREMLSIKFGTKGKQTLLGDMEIK